MGEMTNICAPGPVGTTRPGARFAASRQICRRPGTPLSLRAPSTRDALAASENSSRRTFLRKKRAMMMAIARKPSRIAYSVVVWPSSRSRSSAGKPAAEPTDASGCRSFGSSSSGQKGHVPRAPRWAELVSPKTVRPCSDGSSLADQCTPGGEKAPVSRDILVRYGLVQTACGLRSRRTRTSPVEGEGGRHIEHSLVRQPRHRVGRSATKLIPPR